jgi:hypothetical protein
MTEKPDPPGTSGPQPTRQETTHTLEVSIRPFDPENPSDVLQLHEIDLATRTTTVDVTKDDTEISVEDLKGWMEDEYLFAMEKDVEVFGFVWFTPDDKNSNMTLKVRRLLGKTSLTPMELSFGTVTGVPIEDTLAGLFQALATFKGKFNEGKCPLVTVYTNDDVERDILDLAEFRLLGEIPQYIAENDDGTLEIDDEPHFLYYLDLNNPKNG